MSLIDTFISNLLPAVQILFNAAPALLNQIIDIIVGFLPSTSGI